MTKVKINCPGIFEFESFDGLCDYLACPFWLDTQHGSDCSLNVLFNYKIPIGSVIYIKIKEPKKKKDRGQVFFNGEHCV